MIVAEGLIHGAPVVMTMGTRCSRLRDERCGYQVALKVDALASALTDATSLPNYELREMGARGRKLVAQGYCWDSVAQHVVAEYQRILRHRAAR